MKINIPCPNCGCQYCEAETKYGKKVKIEICRCNDGSGEFEVSIFPDNGNEPEYEKHQCSQEDIATCLANRFNIDLDSMNHQCFN
ncbi:MAG: hypothetical protein BGN92_10035 [Sphingobacteriales bacterium 41-5]|nr:MAG: hypothetical protein BGN92_10035 [Sphingobacteriales bacterium 41-5]